jgi:hypothetical protein
LNHPLRAAAHYQRRFIGYIAGSIVDTGKLTIIECHAEHQPQGAHRAQGSSPTGANSATSPPRPTNAIPPYVHSALAGFRLPAPPMSRMSFNPLFLRPGVPPLAEGGTDFPAATSAGLFRPAFYPMTNGRSCGVVDLFRGPLRATSPPDWSRPDPSSQCQPVRD